MSGEYDRITDPERKGRVDSIAHKMLAKTEEDVRMNQDIAAVQVEEAERQSIADLSRYGGNIFPASITADRERALIGGAVLTLA
jgi:hypothetical protein